jgi:hypothetical protein
MIPTDASSSKETEESTAAKRPNAKAKRGKGDRPECHSVKAKPAGSEAENHGKTRVFVRARTVSTLV